MAKLVEPAHLRGLEVARRRDTLQHPVGQRRIRHNPGTVESDTPFLRAHSWRERQADTQGRSRDRQHPTHATHPFIALRVQRTSNAWTDIKSRELSMLCRARSKDHDLFISTALGSDGTLRERSPGPRLVV